MPRVFSSTTALTATPSRGTRARPPTRARSRDSAPRARRAGRNTTARAGVRQPSRSKGGYERVYPCPVSADTNSTFSGGTVRSESSAELGPAAPRTLCRQVTLVVTYSVGLFAAPSSASSFRVTSAVFRAQGPSVDGTYQNRRVAPPSELDLNALDEVMRQVAYEPDRSRSTTSLAPLGSSYCRVVGSSVANSLSLREYACACQRVKSSVDLPAFV